MGGSESKGREENGETNESTDTALAKESSGTALAKGAIACAAVLALGAGVVSLMGESSKSSEEKRVLKQPWDDDSSDSSEGKTMKAPGRDGRILRQPFEKNPREYFRDLRSEQRNQGESFKSSDEKRMLEQPLEDDSSDSSGGKTMKAPGRDGRILREPFENNPREYFIGLRSEQRKK